MGGRYVLSSQVCGHDIMRAGGGRKSYAERFAARREVDQQARTPAACAQCAPLSKEQGVQTAGGAWLWWRSGTRGTRADGGSTVEILCPECLELGPEGSFRRHWENLQKCREIAKHDLEKFARGVPLPDNMLEQISAGGVAHREECLVTTEREMGGASGSEENGGQTHSTNRKTYCDMKVDFQSPLSSQGAGRDECVDVTMEAGQEGIGAGHAAEEAAPQGVTQENGEESNRRFEAKRRRFQDERRFLSEPQRLSSVPRFGVGQRRCPAEKMRLPGHNGGMKKPRLVLGPSCMHEAENVEARKPLSCLSNKEPTNRRKERAAQSRQVSGGAADLATQRTITDRQQERDSRLPASAVRTQDSSSVFRRKYFSLVGRAQPAPESVKGAASFHPTQATRAKGIRLLRTVMQRKGGKLAKLHRFAWSEARDADGPDEHQASGVALQQYVASHRSCPVVLGSLERHSNGLLGRIVRRMMERWCAGTTYRLVAVGFRTIKLQMTCFGIWRNSAFLRASLERLFGGAPGSARAYTKAYTSLLPNLNAKFQERVKSVHGWSCMQNTVLQLTLIAYDGSLGLSADDQMLLKVCVLACRIRWTSTAVRHLHAWGAWLKHPWRGIRLKCDRDVCNVVLAEWRVVAHLVREKRARDALLLWNRNAHQMRRCKAAFLSLLRCKLSRKRAAAMLVAVLRRVMNQWLWSKWSLRCRMVKRAATFAEMLALGLLRQTCEEWGAARWTRQQHLLFLFGAWAEHAFCDATLRKRMLRIAGADLLTRQASKRLKRYLAKWRLFQAVCTYALNLMLATYVGKWFDAVQVSSWENRQLRLVYRTVFRRQMLFRWRHTTVQVARHRTWKFHLRVSRKANAMIAFREACASHRERRRLKQEAWHNARSYDMRMLLVRRLPVFVSLWAARVVTHKKMRGMQEQADARLERRILVQLARRVCTKYLVLKSARSMTTMAMRAWREKLAETKWFVQQLTRARAHADAKQQRKVLSFLAGLASRRNALSGLSAMFAAKSVLLHFRSWQRRATRRMILNLAHECIEEKHLRRRVRQVLQVLVEHCILQCAKRVWSRHNAAAETRRRTAVHSSCLNAWHEFARDNRRQAAALHACKQACMDELRIKSARNQCATLQGVLLLLQQALSAWQQAAAHAIACRRLSAWEWDGQQWT